MLDITVSCPCGRTMQPDFTCSRGGYRCGCGRTVRVHVPSRLVYQKELCCYVAKFGTCDQPTTLGTSLCVVHIASIIETAAESYGELSLQARKLRKKSAPRAEEDPRSRTWNNHAYTLQLRQRIVDAGMVVYYVRTTPGFVKIGATNNLYARLRHFYLPDDHVLAVEPGDFQVEARRHREFADVQVKQEGRREEFVEREVLANHIREVRAQHGDPWQVQKGLRRAEFERIESEDHDINEAQWRLLSGNDEPGQARVALRHGETAR